MPKPYQSSFHNELDNTYKFESFFDVYSEGRDSKTIFIAIPCYRDDDLVETVESAIYNAKNPDRLFFGIGLIYGEDEERYWEKLKKFKNVKISLKPISKDNIGLGKQRTDANSFYNKEDYFLQLDSHMKFDPHWDHLLISHLEGIKALGDPMPLITGYPRPYAPDEFPNVLGMYPFYNKKSKEIYFRGKDGFNSVPSMRPTSYAEPDFKKNGFPRHGDRIMAFSEAIALAPAISPAQIFADGKYIYDVPADPKLRFLEEEQYYSILSYMKGYTFYTPRVTGIMHFYATSQGEVYAHRPHAMDEFPELFAPDSYWDSGIGGKELIEKLKKTKDAKRSFEDYEKLANISYENKKIFAPVDEIKHNKITSYINFLVEQYIYSTTDYSEWMYNSEYEWREDIVNNEKNL
jgi:hypothetical protein